MSEAGKTFSESWYRVAGQRLCLRPDVQVRRQYYRGERWIVLENPFRNQFFRIRKEAYDFVSRLGPDRTVEEAWRQCLEVFPETAPGQEAVIRLLAQLYYANLLQYDSASDTAKLFDRYRKGQQQQTRATLMQLMFMRIPLLNPDRFLVATLPWVRWLIGPAGLVLWLGIVGLGLKVAIENFSQLVQQSEGMLTPEKLPLLYVAMAGLKALHEFGHAYVCRRYGGQVNVMGVMMLVFTPAPYVDVSSSWSFRNRWQRVLVGLAGMMVELVVASLALLVWVRTGTGTLHNLAYNLIFIASISTLIFNLNPLLRFDGYYILSDLLDIPNLYQKAFQHLRHLLERYVLGIKNSRSPSESVREKSWLVVYGVASAIYRVVVFGGILLFVADRFLLLGIVMAVVCFISWIIIPAARLVYYLGASPKLERSRPRAIAICASFAVVLIACLQFIPFPSHFRADGVLLAKQRASVATLVAGRVKAVVASPNKPVRAGDPLLVLENEQLDVMLAAARAQLQESEARWRAALSVDVTRLAPLASRVEASKRVVEQLQQDHSNLVVRAAFDGLWVLPRTEELAGRWVPRGTALGLLIDPNSFEFSATVAQEELDRLFTRKHQQAEVRMHGECGQRLALGTLKVLPAEQYVLPTIALGWAGGGNIPVSRKDQQGRVAAEPFFSVIGVVSNAQSVAMLHGRTGVARFDVAPEPLLPRGMRVFWQFLQKRYQL